MQCRLNPASSSWRLTTHEQLSSIEGTCSDPLSCGIGAVDFILAVGRALDNHLFFFQLASCLSGTASLHRNTPDVGRRKSCRNGSMVHRPPRKRQTIGRYDQM
ncbi:unnamed protein product [Protopolystoma xenopodis]|uniref:Uncharacterized protein n=1 Tax=Protopolystoma xenopodis TaxID=117903 RepID=A0A3S5BX61_9PLAT|nr:unnamed protein product [Protopolystoma xenopodis]